MGFRTLHLLVPKEKDPVKIQDSHGEVPVGALHYDGAGEAPHPGAGAEIGNATTMPQLPTHSLEAHPNEGAHGSGAMEVGVGSVGVIGMSVMIVARDKSITINHGLRPPIHRHLSHGHRRHSTLPPQLCRSHRHHLWQRLVYGGLPLVARGLKDRALWSTSAVPPWLLRHSPWR